MEEKRCELCGKAFTSNKKVAKYCSRLCADEAYNKKRKEERKKKREEQGKIKCAREGCENYFFPKSSRHRYCSILCSRVAYNERRRAGNCELLGHIEKEIEEKRARREIKSHGLLEYVIDKIKESVSAIEPPKVKFISPKKEGRVEEEACLLISDCQIGEEVLGEEISDLGEYNFEIFKKRMESIVQSVLDITEIHRRAFPVNVLNIAFLGDIVNGELIFEGQYLYNHMNLLDQVFEGAYFMAKMIASLAPHYERLELIGVPGNHGRIGKKGQTKYFVNFDLFFYRVLELILRNCENIVCDFPKSFFAVKEIKGHNFFFLHGDNIKMYLRTPFYGLENSARDYFALLSRKSLFIDYLVVAHFHRSGNFQLPFGEVIVNGSFVGPNIHSIQHLKTGVSPTQLFFGVNEKHGITWRYSLNLEGKCSQL
jgi:hypothetical protein